MKLSLEKKMKIRKMFKEDPQLAKQVKQVLKGQVHAHCPDCDGHAQAVSLQWQEVTTHTFTIEELAQYFKE